MPVLASAGTFATYVLVSEHNILTSAETFTVLLLFIALRFPISYTGRMIGKAAQALESLRRIERFLSREVGSKVETEDRVGVKSDGEAYDESSSILTVSNASFRLGFRPMSEEADEEVLKTKFGFEVSGVGFQLKRGQVLAVVGPVGSG